MSTHPLNSVLRFLLELCALFTFGYWGYHQSESWARILLAIGLPLLFAGLWGVFAVRDDPSRSGKTVVPTPGWIRLFIELALFGAATWMIFDLGRMISGWIFGSIMIIHYIISLNRVRWLLNQK